METRRGRRWAETAVKVLLKKKKQKNNKVTLQTLQKALNCPEMPSKSVTIPRPVDGRMQVLNRKALPHVIDCREGRWPDLRTHNELQSMDCCEHPFLMRRSVSTLTFEYPVLPAVLVPRYRDLLVKKQAKVSDYCGAVDATKCHITIPQGASSDVTLYWS
ncbi:hypothetical protein C0Q70_03471 [Pomacea canaliculata]|uniref:MH1 domain-containing protein n=1 Tax=Pomacea canaliculata TaxID=400727 RepID=A0A2T7PSX8_POMCA|nr:hypothetical protein C0Q70_03471 [Pomacea canaliculata]